MAGRGSRRRQWRNQEAPPRVLRGDERLASLQPVQRSNVYPGQRIWHDFPATVYPGQRNVFMGKPMPAPVSDRPGPLDPMQESHWAQVASTITSARASGWKQLQVGPSAPVATLSAFVIVASLELPTDREATIETIGAQEVGAQGNGPTLTWKFMIDGSASSQFPPIVGTFWASPTPYRCALKVPAGCTLQLAVSDPNAVKTLAQGYLTGFTNPITRGKGRYSAGFEPRF